ncbi:acyl-CoA dehydrogenase family protein [Hydrogenophaga sp.]|uniref:acyl-CoA dehydrogenase family protein n=1 Tax=Hydrogenophaga sp. TaxID=1904254 RepID=UPI00261FB575|nr:acyl-CoA dehydrogenase family protein [Hydrogenophaga sp.]MCW5654738.1 acyl-CoA dehydrogenase family protein [Hydrogenophaga sp.]
MDFRLTPEQQTFRAEVRAFIQERLPDDIRQRLRNGHPARKEDVVRFQRILHERGWAAPHWPKKFGGADLGQAERLILQEEIQRAPAPMPAIFNVVMLGPLLLRYGTEAQCTHFLPKLANADLWFCQGFSEPGSGSDLASLRTSARREGDEYVVNGQKIWTSSAHQADWMFCLVRTEQAARKQDGITFLLIDMKTPGLTVRPIVSIDHAHHLNEVFFDNVRVPVANLVGEEGKGWACAKFLLGNERTGIANVSYCRERLEHARHLARTITQAGRPLAEDPVLQAELAALDAQVRALEVTNWRMLLAPGTALAGESFASVLKLKGTEIQQALVALIARLAGPTGLERRPGDGPGSEHWAAPAAPRYFQSRAASIYGGSSEIQKDILAKAALG